MTANHQYYTEVFYCNISVEQLKKDISSCQSTPIDCRTLSTFPVDSGMLVSSVYSTIIDNSCHCSQMVQVEATNHSDDAVVGLGSIPGIGIFYYVIHPS